MRTLITIVGSLITLFNSACEDRLYEIPNGNGHYAKEVLAKFRVEREAPMQLWTGPMDLNVKYTGMGSSDFLGVFKLKLDHVEFYTGSREFSVRNGVLVLENEDGDRMEGTYIGIGDRTGRNLKIRQTWTVISASGIYQPVQGKTLFANIALSPFDGSSEIVITGNIN